ncbi:MULTISPECIES: HupE/UreJ family protein [Flavobacteriaceae]|uniref:HupE/UreJ family protein n=2 Tax=Flavobacteriaceae TaxID=49546 RepID=A0ABN1JCG6_9FLAO|nr:MULTISPECIES: HupE/UreJ family protein [Meridianimaribacter]RYH73450.1 HupE/UreJ family protein [Flavobacteriaceae bacterium 144Ye]TBV25167.1 HupE/UreJ family protein [Meridianimaribacter sp. CL38]TDY10582.1 HupE/UreJ protein [Meridianimaribacter flavus]
MLDDFLSNLQHGIYHILNVNAYEHIVFLIVLAVPYLFKDWKRILLLITVFTLGHTVSLLLATYNVISVNSSLVGFLIPLIILVVALYNVFTAGKKAHNEKVGILFLSTLFFGLIHGLGYVGTFESLIKASDNKLLSALEISLGIEVGQIIVAFIVVFLGFLCQTIFRFSKRDWVMVVSAIVVGLLIPMLIRSNIFS